MLLWGGQCVATVRTAKAGRYNLLGQALVMISQALTAMCRLISLAVGRWCSTQQAIKVAGTSR